MYWSLLFQTHSFSDAFEILAFCLSLEQTAWNTLRQIGLCFQYRALCSTVLYTFDTSAVPSNIKGTLNTNRRWKEGSPGSSVIRLQKIALPTGPPSLSHKTRGGREICSATIDYMSAWCRPDSTEKEKKISERSRNLAEALYWHFTIKSRGVSRERLSSRGSELWK